MLVSLNWVMEKLCTLLKKLQKSQMTFPSPSTYTTEKWHFPSTPPLAATSLIGLFWVLCSLITTVSQAPVLQCGRA